MSIEKEQEDFPEESLPSDYADALKEDRKDAEEQLKELSGDYKADYNQYLKEKDNPKEENDEKDELIRDYRSGFDFDKKEGVDNPEKTSEVNNQEKANEKKPQKDGEKEQTENSNQEKDKESVMEDGKKENKKEGEKQESKVENEVNSGEAPEGAPFQAKRKEKELKEREGVPFQKKEKEEVSLIEKQTLINAYNNLSKIAKQKEGLKGLLSKLGIGKSNSEIENEYIEAQKIYNQAIDKIKEKTGEERYEIEEKYAGVEKENKETRFESVKNFLKKKKEEVGNEIEALDPEKKGLFNKFKNLMKNKKFQYAVGLAIAGISIAAPPTGFISMVTFGLHPGFLPVAYATKATALLGIAGGALIANGISGWANELKKKGKNNLDLTESIEKKPDTNQLLP